MLDNFFKFIQLVIAQSGLETGQSEPGVPVLNPSSFCFEEVFPHSLAGNGVGNACSCLVFENQGEKQSQIHSSHLSCNFFFLPPGDTWQCLNEVLIVTTWERVC